MFRNNQNKQRTNWNSSTFVKISTFLIPHTISSVCFGSFDTAPKHRNKPKNFFLGFAKKQTEKQPKHIEFWFVSVRTEKKKLTVLRTPKFFWDLFSLFWFVLRKFCLFRLFQYRSETPKQTEKNEKNVFWFRETNQKTTETGRVSVRTEEKIWLFRGHPTPYEQEKLFLIDVDCLQGFWLWS